MIPDSLSRRLALAALLALGGAALALALGPWWRGAPPPTAARTAEALAATLDLRLQRDPRDATRGVAIRPLAPPEADPDTVVLADTVCETLVSAIARAAGGRVPSCSSSRLAWAGGLDDAALGRLLAVDHVLHGRIEAMPDGQVGVQLALHDLRLEKPRWRIDERMPLAGLQTLPERVVRAFTAVDAAAAGARDAATRTTVPAGGSTAELPPQAYARYLRAVQLMRRFTLEERREALRLFDEVLAVAPDHAPSLHQRWLLRTRLDGYEGGALASAGSVEDAAAAQAALRREARALGERLIALDPSDRRALGLMLNAELADKQWQAAFARADTLLAVAASQPGVLRTVARLHLMAGYVRRAHELSREAVRLDALDPDSLEYLASTHGMLGDDAAMAELLTIARQVGHGGIDFFDTIRAHRRADWPAFERAMSAYAVNTQRDAGWVPAYVQGLVDPARREAAAALLDGHDATLRHYMSDYFFEYALLGDVARSSAAIALHAKADPKLWLEYLWWPELAAVRQTPAFAQAMAEQGLTTLWAARGAPDLCQPQGATWTCR